MWETVKRNRNRLLAAATVGAAGAATAYYCYYRWTEPRACPDDRNTAASNSSGAGPSTSTPADAAVTAQLVAERERDAQLQAHFDSIQALSGRTTVPSMLPKLMDFLCAATDVEAITAQLRQARGGGSALGAAEKYALWQELKLASFTRALSAAWALPALELLLRCQLSLLGRHLVVQQAAGRSKDARSGGGAAGVRVQELFLVHAEFLPQYGVDTLASLMRTAVTKVVGGIGLKEAVSSELLLLRISEVHGEFEAAVAQLGLPALMLPGPEHVRRHTREALGLPPGGGSGVRAEEAAVCALTEELRTLLAGQLFANAMREAVREAASVMAASLRDAMAAGGSSTAAVAGGGGDGGVGQPPSLPLAKALPLVAGAAQALAAAQPALSAAMSELPAVKLLATAAYAGLPAAS